MIEMAKKQLQLNLDYKIPEELEIGDLVRPFKVWNYNLKPVYKEAWPIGIIVKFHPWLGNVIVASSRGVHPYCVGVFKFEKLN